jgi:pSer/pThr/pTyr-binding forkhead associated (FHA) protein
MAYIVMRRGPDPGKVYKLNKDATSLGRGNKNHIVIHDNEVSREHVRFLRLSEGYELHDLKSSNGTYINGQRVDRVWLLRSNCLIELGDSITLEFFLGEPEPALTQSHNMYYMGVTIEGELETQIFPLNKSHIVVGRGSHCDVKLSAAEVSREHFEIVFDGDQYTVCDLNSTNGTSLNGEFVTKPKKITLADTIYIGQSVRFQVTDRPDAYTNRMNTDLLDTSRLQELTLPGETAAELRAMLGRNTPKMRSMRVPSEIGTGLDGISLMDKVLVGYSRADWGRVVAPMIDQMMTRNIDLWAEQYLTENSQDWLLATEQARSECWLLVVVVSPQALRQGVIQKHMLHFQNRDKPIIALVYQHVEQMPNTLNNAIRIEYNPALPADSFEQLVREIKRLQPRSWAS